MEFHVRPSSAQLLRRFCSRQPVCGSKEGLADYHLRDGRENYRWANPGSQNLGKNHMPFQLGIGISDGRLVGFFVHNVFFVVWLDAVHDLYPDNK